MSHWALLDQVSESLQEFQGADSPYAFEGVFWGRFEHSGKVIRRVPTERAIRTGDYKKFKGRLAEALVEKKVGDKL